MNKDLNHYKSKLEEERTTLINELKSVAVHTESKDKDDWEATPMTEVDSADSNNVADRISSYENNDAIVRDLENRLREVDHALIKIEDKAYGNCEVCNETIEEDRLEANPAARTCKKHLNERLGSPQI